MTKQVSSTLAQRIASAFLAVAFAGSAAHAHPGHGLFEHGGTHLVASPFHSLTLALLPAGLVLAARLARAPRVRAGLQFTAGASLVLAAIVWLGR